VSVAEAAHRPANSGRAVALWLGFLLIIAAAVGLAWVGAGSLRPVVTSSGLQFRTVKAGKGAPIGHDDAALLDYVLTSDDGNVIESIQALGPEEILGRLPRVLQEAEEKDPVTPGGNPETLKETA